MATDLAELSSIASSLDQLARRVGTMGEGAREEREEEVASELFAVERAIAAAQRRVTRLVSRSR